MIPSLFTLRDAVDRRMYAVVGFTLMALKYAVDAIVIGVLTGELWTPLDYLSPLVSVRADKLANVPAVALLALALWTLPFVWIGVTMSVRRAADAGFSPWMGLAFLVPFANYALMLLLAVAPSRPTATGDRWRRRRVSGVDVRDRLASAAVGIGAAVVLALLALLLSVYGFGSYGATLFIGVPVLLGAVSAYRFNRGHSRDLGESVGVALLALLITGGIVILLALEGFLCVALALPPAIVATVLGAAVGHAIASYAPQPRTSLFAVLLVPIGLSIEKATSTNAPRALSTSVAVARPPDVVWPQVVQFAEISDPPEWFFRLGLAYPTRARMVGEGVGAIRYCEFSTGAFVEPITLWDPPRRLAFDVESQPPPLRELSPYSRVYAPHLDGMFRTTAGQFLLEPIDGGRGTRITGTTWYSQPLAPAQYWLGITDAVIRRIHLRVLRQIARDAERG